MYVSTTVQLPQDEDFVPHIITLEEAGGKGTVLRVGVQSRPIGSGVSFHFRNPREIKDFAYGIIAKVVAAEEAQWKTTSE